MRKRYVVGNWKMNFLARDAAALAREIRETIGTPQRTEVWLAPSFLSIPAVAEAVKGSCIQVGSQSLHGEPKGTFTGEVSADMLKEFGGTFAIIGHSERRWVLGETDSVVSAKAVGALHQGITPIFCIGENREEHNRGLTHEVLRIQLAALFERLKPGEIEKVMIAYEPCWAISSGKEPSKIPTPEIIGDVHSFILNSCKESNTCAPLAILYGGSANGSNFTEILSVPHVDGGLIGGASLTAKAFCELIPIAERG